MKRAKVQELPAMTGPGVEVPKFKALDALADEFIDVRDKKAKLAEQQGLLEEKIDGFMYEPFLREGKTPRPRYACKHLVQVRAYFQMFMCQTVVKRRMQEANANRAEHGHGPVRYDPELPVV